MIRNYLYVAIRSLLKNKVLTFVNITGLSFGLLCSILLAFWVWNELAVDKFHSKKENLYRILGEIKNSEESFITNYAPSAIAEPLADQTPEVKEFCRTFPAQVVFTREEIRYQESGIYADPSLFRLFDFALLEGSVSNIKDNPNSVVISERLASKYFPGESALGKNIGVVYNKLQNYVVAGVMKDIPQNSSLQFDFVMSYDAFETAHRPWWKSNNQGSFNNFNVFLYVELVPGANIEELNDKLSTFIPEYTQQGSMNEMFAYPYEDIYLHSDFSAGRVPTGSITYVKLISIIAVVIFIIACINFINMTTAMAGLRAKEVGLRKTSGATRRQIIIQFLIESILVSMFSMIIALTFMEILIPSFNILVGRQMDVPFESVTFISIVLGFTLLAGILAGLYPAIVLSSFKPMTVLKDTRTPGVTLGWLRKGLVMVQFTLSIGFIIYTIVAHNQISFIQNKELGLKKDNIIFHSLNGIRSHKEAYKNELEKIDGVEHVAFTEQDPYHTSNGVSNVNWTGKSDQNKFFNVIQVGGDFLETFELQLINGTGFSGVAQDVPTEIILNESARKVLNIEDPAGMKIGVWGYEGTIKGVVKDFHHQSLAYGIEPLIIVFNPQQTWNAYISLKPENIQKTLQHIRDVYMQNENEYPFDYQFSDEYLISGYNDVLTTGKLSDIFSSVAIVIACLGLFGLSAFMAEQRKLETGVRKVLGAREAGLVYLFSLDFAKLVLYSFIIASPVAWYFSDQWLTNFTYHDTIGIAPFIIAGIGSLLVALLTISYNTIKAARVNPVELLRHP